MIPPPPPPPPPVSTQLENMNWPQTRERPRSLLVVCLSLINTVTHILIGAVACVAFLIANTLSSVSANSIGQHIYLCVTGYVILMSQAIMTVSSNGWTSTLKSREKKIIHTSMQIMGSTLAIAGSIVRMSDVEEHFQSTHGILGILAFIFSCISLIGGVIAFCTNVNPTIVKIGHACFGSLTITLAFVSLIYGFRFLFETEDNANLNMMISLTVMALLGTLIQTCVNLFRKLQKSK